MSMLTPPGMGGNYRITGNRYPRMRRPTGRRRLVLAAVGSAAALGLLGWGTVQLIDVFSGDDEGTRTAAHGTEGRGDCADGGRDTETRSQPATGPNPSATAVPKPSQITVNVYNATERTGLAKETAEALEKRGFRIGEVGNATAEYDKKIKAPGLLLGAPAATNGAFDVLGTQVRDVRTKNDARGGKDVDLIIGDAFTDLTAKREADRALAALTKPAPSAADGAAAKCEPTARG
ncbi:LytR C-terminal domain-containing protein [Streptomyces sp. LX-29]|uniref:LytR C-terminal domain-containing protein n=1 Tax=Streptomyces sp. LX-29 TaxID=2900152 RepID=UPI00240E0D0D|nr:LytR C-terminal domain-containing protein [Streptomyces sp. LX-29]WFB08305.1 LytR C-terminal domain-containing protein [Streptomyces sp. LX-29]